MYVHIQKYQVGIRQSVRQAKMTGHGQKCLKQYVVHLAMPPPKVALQNIRRIVL
jgi:hypothetical protein